MLEEQGRASWGQWCQTGLRLSEMFPSCGTEHRRGFVTGTGVNGGEGVTLDIWSPAGGCMLQEVPHVLLLFLSIFSFSMSLSHITVVFFPPVLARAPFFFYSVLLPVNIL